MGKLRIIIIISAVLGFSIAGALWFGSGSTNPAVAVAAEDHDDHEGHDHDKPAEKDEHEGHDHDKPAEKDEHEGHDHDKPAEKDEHEGHDHDKPAEKDEHEGHDHDKHAEKDEHAGCDHGDEIDQGEVKLTEQDIRDFNIEIKEVGTGSLDMQVALQGQIVFNGDKVAHIGPRFGGIVRRVNKNLGDKVYKGQTLATLENNESLQHYALTSPIKGTVIEKNIYLGEVLSEDSEPFVVADLSSLWIDLRVFEKDIPHIKTGQSVNIQAGKNYPEVTGVISYVGRVIDRETRSVLARVILQNAFGEWQPGIFVTGYVIIDDTPAKVVVRNTAIQTVFEKLSVFIKTKKGFEPKPVRLGRKSKTHTEIIAGLRQGQQYVADGAFVLKAQIEKSSYDPHAGHNH